MQLFVANTGILTQILKLKKLNFLVAKWGYQQIIHWYQSFDRSELIPDGDNTHITLLVNV